MKPYPFGLASLFVVLAQASAFVSAAPVASWDYQVSSVFRASSTTFTGGNGNGISSASQISWGRAGGVVGVNRSALQITDSPSSSTLLTDGPSQIANTYTHINNGNIGSNSTTLKSAQIDATLGLRVTGAGGGFSIFTTDYSVLFAETPNVAGTCASVSVVACNDIFVLSGSLNESFIFDGFQYFVSFFAAPSLTQLTNAECAAAGAAAGCSGFTTPEFQDTAVTFNLQITSRPIEVPEPASIALIGAGLFGLLAMRGRKRAPQA